MYQYLEDYIYYDELYDKFTIEECQRWENNPHQADIPKLKGKEKKLGELKNKFSRASVMPVALLFLKIDRATKKSDTIQEWMARDRAKDNKLANQSRLRLNQLMQFLIQHTEPEEAERCADEMHRLLDPNDFEGSSKRIFEYMDSIIAKHS